MVKADFSPIEGGNLFGAFKNSPALFSKKGDFFFLLVRGLRKCLAFLNNQGFWVQKKIFFLFSLWLIGPPRGLLFNRYLVQ